MIKMMTTIVCIAVAIALQYSVFDDDDNDDSPRFKSFKCLREPLLAEIKQALLASAEARQLYARAKADDDQQSARAHAREAYQIDWKILKLFKANARFTHIRPFAGLLIGLLEPCFDFRVWEVPSFRSGRCQAIVRVGVLGNIIYCFIDVIS